MKWTKLKEPYKAEIIHDVNLYDKNGKICASASKQNPIKGTVTHYGYKKIGRNNVEVVLFRPDTSGGGYEISRKWIRKQMAKRPNDVSIGGLT